MLGITILKLFYNIRAFLIFYILMIYMEIEISQKSQFTNMNNVLNFKFDIRSKSFKLIQDWFC